MVYSARDWNIKQKNLRVFLLDPKTFEKGKKLLLEMHSLLHDRKVYKNSFETFYDNLWDNLKEETCKIISKKETSILWNIWHISRIEDIIANIIMGNKEAILNKEIQTKINVKIKDTGNAMTYSEIELFSNKVNIKALNEYRFNVGKSTKKIIETLEFNDMKRKVTKEQLEKIKQNGGVTNDPKSVWLLDFWGKKNIFGLIMMPITRHQIVHLNDSLIIKAKNNK
jgi:hypothetical protein